MRRATAAKLTAVAALAALAGCSSAPLPGGEGGDGYRVAIEFADVTDLVPYSTVKVDDVTVGQVEEITVSENWTAKVSVRVRGDVELPANATAALRQTSLLGEKFVELAAPEKSKPVGSLADGDTIPLKRTDKGAEVEEVLGAVALVLQGGGLDQLRTINTELSDLMAGREDEIKDSLGELDEFMSNLDDQRDDIVIALEALEGLSGDLAEQKETIGAALDSIAPGITTLANQREQITDAITALGDLGEVGADVIQQSGDETTAILADLQPVLENLVAAGDHFPQGLELAGSYPFPHNVTETIEDDFVNLHITLDGSLENILGNVLGDKPVTQADPDDPESTPGETGGGSIDPITGGIEDLLGGGVEGDDATEEEGPVKTKKLRYQIGVFALISLLGIAYVGVRYLGWFDSSYTVYAQAKEAGGAYEHAAVAYRGVPVGKVGAVTLHDGGARLELRIDSATKVPADVKAVVAQRSAVGEQYVDLRPNTASGPYLGEGDVIDEVTTPLPMEQLLANLDGLIESVDPDDLKIVIDELGKAFEGNEDSLDKMLDATQTLIDDAAEHLPETVDLLKDGKTVLETQEDSASAIRTWADKLAKLTGTIKESDSDIRELIDEAPKAADDVSGLIRDLDPSLGTLLGNMISVNGVAVQRLPNIETVLVTYPMVVSGGSTVTPGDGTAHFGLVLNFDNPPPCVYGEGNDEYACTDQELAEGSAPRGWQSAPGPTGPAIEPVPLPASGTSKDDDGGSGGDESSSDTESSSYGYDPLTGLLVDGDGLPIQFGSTGGQYELAGEESWKSLLLTGVMS